MRREQAETVLDADGAGAGTEQRHLGDEASLDIGGEDRRVGFGQVVALGDDDAFAWQGPAPRSPLLYLGGWAARLPR